MNNVKKTKDLEKTVFLIDDSVLVVMISKSNSKKDKSSVAILNKLQQMRDEEVPYKAFTTLACFLRSLWITEKIDLDRVKKVIDLIDIAPLPSANFKDEESVRTQLIKVANIVSTKPKEERPFEKTAY